MAVTLTSRFTAFVSAGRRPNDQPYRALHEGIQESEWTLVNAETGNFAEMAKWPDKSVQVTGTFGAGGTVVVEGSNDGTTYFTLTDQAGAALSFTAAGLRQIRENTMRIRGRVSAGDGTTSLKVLIVGTPV